MPLGKSRAMSRLLVLIIIVVLVLLYIFRGQLGLGGHTTNINVPDKIDVNVNHS